MHCHATCNFRDLHIIHVYIIIMYILDTIHDNVLFLDLFCCLNKEKCIRIN
jgi:hypothetical protein